MRIPPLCGISSGALLGMALSACSAVPAWFAGVDRDNFDWQPASASAPAWNVAVRECESPGQAAQTDPTRLEILRSEASDVVASCMAQKGFVKVYRNRTSVF
jgi:hypothetical protein